MVYSAHEEISIENKYVDRIILVLMENNNYNHNIYIA